MPALPSPRVRPRPAAAVACGSGAGASAERIDLIAQRMQELQVEEQLLRLYGDQRREREIFLDLQQRYAEQGQTVSDAALQQAAAEIAAQERLNEALREQARVRDMIIGGIGNALAAGARGIDAMRQSLAGLAAQLTQLLTNRLLMQFLTGTSLGGGILSFLGGSLGGAMGGVTAKLAHGGGMVGAGGATRSVNPLAFAGAPRMHNGGWAGLAPDEVPTILQRGERVLSRREAQQSAMGGNMQVIVQNYTGQPVRESKSRGPDGQELVTIAVGEGVARGRYDKQFRGRFGMMPRQVQR